MEALTGVAVALLTVYDMCKAVDKTDEDRRDHAPEENEIGRHTVFVIPIRQSAERDLAIAMRAFSLSENANCWGEIPRPLRGSG